MPDDNKLILDEDAAAALKDASPEIEPEDADQASPGPTAPYALPEGE